MNSPSSPPKWTREPLKVFNGYILVNGSGKTIADCGTTRSLPGMDADATRLASCWNALLPIESPEDFVREVREVLKEVVEAVNPAMRGQAADKAARLLSLLNGERKDER